MNIFYLHADPKLAAQMHCNKHCLKMILESAQLLSTAHRMLDGKEYQGLTKSGRKIRRWDLTPDLNDFIYTATHINHPCAIWARQNSANYFWLAELAYELCLEYTFRYGKTHKCQSDGLIDFFLLTIPKNIFQTKETSVFPQAMPDAFKVPGDSVAAYRKYYLTEKQRMLTWTGSVNTRETPYWVSDHLMKETT